MVFARHTRNDAQPGLFESVANGSAGKLGGIPFSPGSRLKPVTEIIRLTTVKLASENTAKTNNFIRMGFLKYRPVAKTLFLIAL